MKHLLYTALCMLLLQACKGTDVITAPTALPVTVELTASGDSLSTFDPVTFHCKLNGISSDRIKYRWQFGESSLSSATTLGLDSVTTYYSNRGNFSVSVTVTDLNTNTVIGNDAIILTISDSTRYFPIGRYLQCTYATAVLNTEKVFDSLSNKSVWKKYATTSFPGVSGMWIGNTFRGGDNFSNSEDSYQLHKVTNNIYSYYCHLKEDSLMFDSISFYFHHSVTEYRNNAPPVEVELSTFELRAINIPIDSLSTHYVKAILDGSALREHIQYFDEQEMNTNGSFQYKTTNWNSTKTIPMLTISFN